MKPKDQLLANGPVMADYGGVDCVAIVKVPVRRCGASGPGHYPHRSEGRGDWTYCPGDNAR